jgi:hypothetical protein
LTIIINAHLSIGNRFWRTRWLSRVKSKHFWFDKISIIWNCLKMQLHHIFDSSLLTSRAWHSTELSTFLLFVESR